MGETDVDYWPDLIWQWITVGCICSIIAAESPNLLKQKDQKNAWRMTHASVALRVRTDSSDREIQEAEICKQVLTALKQRSYLSLYAAKDRDGDTPLHSVVKTGDVNRLKILLDRLPPKLLRDVLEMTNKLGQTPLKISFEQEEWDMLEVLLDYCIKNGLCSNLTGVGENLPASKTLLHHAMDKGCSQFVETYFDVTTRNHEYGKPGLLVCDQNGRTPWFYLMNHKDSKILRSILCTLQKHKININELITDKFSRSTMLHLAYRKQHQECIRLLIEAGADPERQDMRGLRAEERDHLIGGSRKRAHYHEKNREQIARDQERNSQSMQSAGIKAPSINQTASDSQQIADAHNGQNEDRPSPYSAKSEVVNYWPHLIWQWITVGGICDIIAATSPNFLKQKDQKNAWRMTHASVAMRVRTDSSNREIQEAEICKQVLTALKQRGYLSLYAAKDRDGDTPLHSVVKTGDVNRLYILLDLLPPKLIRNILEMPNKLGQTPLKVAFDQEEWKTLELLLEYCIKNGLCSNLTGVGENLPASKTLLHHAMDKGCSQFVETYFDVTTRNGYGKPGLLVYDENGRTPWFYLMNHKDSKILGSILDTLKKHNIGVNELITDKFSQSTMLHLAYRKQHQDCIQLLEEAGADPKKKDMRGLRADQRDHLIESSQKRAREKKRGQLEKSEEAVQEETLGGIDQPQTHHQLCIGSSSICKVIILLRSYNWLSQSGVPSLENTTCKQVMPSSNQPFSSECPPWCE